VIDPEPSEWVLVDIHPEGFHRGVGHGSLDLWSQDGRLLGVASRPA
jgi:acyl-CoA thioesterase